jgi:hypothetical protein
LAQIRLCWRALREGHIAKDQITTLQIICERKFNSVRERPVVFEFTMRSSRLFTQRSPVSPTICLSGGVDAVFATRPDCGTAREKSVLLLEKRCAFEVWTDLIIVQRPPSQTSTSPRA